VAYEAREDDKRFVVVDGIEGKEYDAIGEGSLIFSPDSQKVAYSAQMSNKWFVVMGGIEGKEYDAIQGLIFCPDSKRVAYAAQVGNWFVVVDGLEGEQYDEIVTVGGGRIIFDSPDSLHYLAVKGNRVYLVEEILR
jgi:roadblock/LC7 domain-containing protein